jgi:hypothetical protein
MNVLKFGFLAISAVACLSATTVVLAQDSEINPNAPIIRKELKDLQNYRYGNISIMELSNLQPLVDVLVPLKKPDINQFAGASNCKAEFQDEIRRVFDEDGGEFNNEEHGNITKSGPCKAYIAYTQKVKEYEEAIFDNAYVVTIRYNDKRFDRNETPKIIGLLTVKNSVGGSGVEDNIGQVSNPYTVYDLEKLQISNTSLSLKEYCENQILQGAYEDKTSDIQDLGTGFLAKRVGVADTVSQNDVQTYIRISEGSPIDFYNPHVLTVGAFDGISYLYYGDPVKKIIKETVMVPDYADSSKMVKETIEKEVLIYNRALPKYGAELKYGMEDINFPSVWSNRMSLNAIWGGAKLGVVLPTSGWAGVSESFGAKRTLTTAGIGVNGSLDFNIPIIPSETGVFNASASFVSGNATISDELLRQSNKEGFELRNFLIRSHAALSYTFAIKVDNTNLFRFRLGGAFYGVEAWYETTVPDGNGFEKDTSINSRNQFIGGILGRVEYMNTGASTPFGVSIQFFDAALSGTAWLQIPITEEFNLRLDGRFFAPAIREAYSWENSSVFLPTARFILNF